jgi:hypothetical protein
MNNPILLLINVEHGNAYWEAALSLEEFIELQNRWKTIRGLHCLVPVNLIIPQAKPIAEEPNLSWNTKYNRRCHIHMHSDSWLEGINYRIPEAEYFHMEGQTYLDEVFYE